jgi:hypothetical protein
MSENKGVTPGEKCQLGIPMECDNIGTTNVTINSLKGTPLTLTACHLCAKDAEPKSYSRNKKAKLVRFQPAWKTARK